MAKHHKKAHKPVQEESKKVKILRILSAVSIFLPCITYLLLILWIFPARDSSFNLLGLIAAFFLGLSLYVLIRCTDPAAFGFHISSAGFISLFFGGLGIILMVFAPICSKVLSKDQRTSRSSLLPVAWASAFMRTCLLVLPYERKSGSAHSGI